MGPRSPLASGPACHGMHGDVDRAGKDCLTWTGRPGSAAWPAPRPRRPVPRQQPNSPAPALPARRCAPVPARYAPADHSRVHHRHARPPGQVIRRHLAWAPVILRLPDPQCAVLPGASSLRRHSSADAAVHRPAGARSGGCRGRPRRMPATAQLCTAGPAGAVPLRAGPALAGLEVENETVASGLIRCEHCGQANRVPAAAAGTPRCGKYHPQTLGPGAEGRPVSTAHGSRKRRPLAGEPSSPTTITGAVPPAARPGDSAKPIAAVSWISFRC
jgi:hypothetical protein